MNKNNANVTEIHIALLLVLTIFGAGLIAEGITNGWEAWVLPLLFVGILLAWFCHVRQLFTARMRIYLYAGYLMFALFFHGVHPTGVFDLSLLTVMLLAIFAQTDRRRFIVYAYAEYLILMAVQIALAIRGGTFQLDQRSVERLVLHVVCVTMVYFLCRGAFERVDRLRNALVTLNEEKQKADEQTEDFLANISHEFRTPINAVTGLSALYLEEKEEPRIREIFAAGKRLAEQTDDILDYTEIVGHQVLLTKEDFDTSAFFHDTVERWRSTFRDSGLEFIVNLDARLPRILSGDTAKLSRVLDHLLSNALKFTREGCVCLQVSMAVRKYGINLDIRVSDTGIGMARNEIALLSKGLYQSNRKRDRSTGGIGLGYAIIYGIVNEMEGFVRIESQPSVGTTAGISIPLSVTDARSCISVKDAESCFVAAYFMPEKYKVPQARVYAAAAIAGLFDGIGVSSVQVSAISELTVLCEEEMLTHIFTGREEYEANRMFFDAISRTIHVAVVTSEPLGPEAGEKILALPAPIYAYSVAKALNAEEWLEGAADVHTKPDFSGVNALIVDDEDMNLVVAEGLFGAYHLGIDTAGSGMEAIDKFCRKDYDVIFMDHMMPGMDGVETARRIKKIAAEEGRSVHFVALTANTISSARKLFEEEGFEGFLAKPIDTAEFERVMRRIIRRREGGAA